MRCQRKTLHWTSLNRKGNLFKTIAIGKKREELSLGPIPLKQRTGDLFSAGRAAEEVTGRVINRMSQAHRVIPEFANIFSVNYAIYVYELVSRDVKLLTFHRDSEIGALSSLKFIFQKDGSKVLHKDIPTL